MADLHGARRSASAGSTAGPRPQARAEVHSSTPRRPSLATSERVGLDYRDLPRDVKPGDTLLLNDGLLR